MSTPSTCSRAAAASAGLGVLSQAWSVPKRVRAATPVLRGDGWDSRAVRARWPAGSGLRPRPNPSSAGRAVSGGESPGIVPFVRRAAAVFSDTSSGGFGSGRGGCASTLAREWRSSSEKSAARSSRASESAFTAAASAASAHKRSCQPLMASPRCSRPRGAPSAAQTRAMPSAPQDSTAAHGGTGVRATTAREAAAAPGCSATSRRAASAGWACHTLTNRTRAPANRAASASARAQATRPCSSNRALLGVAAGTKPPTLARGVLGPLQPRAVEPGFSRTAATISDTSQDEMRPSSSPMSKRGGSSRNAKQVAPQSAGCGRKEPRPLPPLTSPPKAAEANVATASPLSSPSSPLRPSTSVTKKPGGGSLWSSSVGRLRIRSSAPEPTSATGTDASGSQGGDSSGG
mmetsp:Transcript_17188/g.56161  ORF Transcript_17188/g.56161 Transcript_17188/m.56161 type:complete len:404 (-) Transcript_17188:861-2072(-)